MPQEHRGIRAFLVDAGLRAILTLPRVLPYRWRIALVGWITAHVVAPLAGYDQRVRDNLALIRPDLSPAQVKRLQREVSDNAGRKLAEMYSVRAFKRRIAGTPLTGPGVPALEAARAAGRPIIAVTGHFGNYDAPRVALARAGHRIGGLYRPLSNAYFSRHYERALSRMTEPVFAQSRRGLAEMIRHLRAGNMIALLTDQRDPDGEVLSFFGHPALTPMSAAEMALKYDALLVPAYGIRRENGLDFDIVVDPPIAHSDPATMMQAVNDSLEAQVRAHMGQWLWVHRRWLMPDTPQVTTT